MDLEEVRAQLLIGQAGDDRDQVARAGDAVPGGERRAVVEQVAHLGLVLAEHGGDAEEQVEAAHGLDPRRDRQHRHVGAVGGDEARGAAAHRRHDQRRQAEPVDGADGALGDRVGDVLGRLVGAA